MARTTGELGSPPPPRRPRDSLTSYSTMGTGLSKAPSGPEPLASCYAPPGSRDVTGWPEGGATRSRLLPRRGAVRRSVPRRVRRHVLPPPGSAAHRPGQREPAPHRFCKLWKQEACSLPSSLQHSISIRYAFEPENHKIFTNFQLLTFTNKEPN